MIPNAFDISKEYLLEDEMVLLRPLTEADFQFLEHFSIAEPEIWKFSLVQASSPEKMRQYIQSAVAARQKNEYPFIVWDKRTNQYAGCTRFYDIQPDNKVLQLGYTWYGKEFQGTGLNKHCKFLLLSFAFEQIGMERVEFRADNDNARSIRAMQGIGCTVEGVLRSNGFKPDGNRRDSIVLSILKEEWFAGVKAALERKL
jgi:RimJ/RimL family protein N-acetyltransferase